MDQHVKTWVGTVLLIIIAATATSFVWLYEKKSGTMDQLSTGPQMSRPIKVETAAPNVVSDNSQPTDQVPLNFQDKSVDWYPTPKEVKLKLLKSKDFPYKIWEVGNLSGNNGKIYLAAINNEDPSGIITMRFVQASFNTKDLQIRLLSKYSSAELSSYDWNSDVVVGSADDWTKIPSLDFPGIITGPNSSVLNKEQDFPVGDNLDSIFFDNIKSTLASSQKVFSDPVYGDFLIGNDQGLYIKAPDGSYRVYSMAMNIVGKNSVPNVVWNDGSTNSDPYTFKAVGGCGLAGYAALASNDGISENDLTQIGKAGGADIYGLKDPNADYLKKWYKEDVDSFKQQGNTFYALSGNNGKFSNKTSYEQFLSIHPLFYWKDPLGRMIRFLNSDYIDGSGGCGKPVIYLYPEQTENVSVQVTPTGGMSKSDPAYGGGWNVTADPESNITNLADGKTYPYLFWEGRGNSIYQIPKYGFVTSRADLEQTLDEKLAQLGLISKEITDFKAFWLPRILAENKPYYFVTFVSRQEIDALAPLSITPRPDTIIRVLMDYRGLDNYENVPGFTIKTPVRSGFTAVEWGGVLK